MLERLPERARTRSVAEAITSPSAVLMAGSAISAAVLAGAPIAAAAAVGFGAYCLRVALAVPRFKQAKINPGRLNRPWRDFVEDAMRAQIRFSETVNDTSVGPLQDRLGSVGERVGDAVRECWRIASQADNVKRGQERLSMGNVQDELRAARVARDSLHSDNAGRASLDRTIAALEAQLKSGQRLSAIIEELRDRLRLINAQLDEAVARAVELSLHSTDLRDVDPLLADVDSLVGELETMRQAVDETRQVANPTLH